MGNNRNLLGKWAQETKDGYHIIEVLEVDGNIVRAVGKNMTVDELLRNYKRPDDLTDNPYTANNLAMTEFQVHNVDNQKQAETKVAQDETIESTETNNIDLSSIDYADASLVVVSESPQHKFVKDAIDLSNSISQLDVSVKVNVPFDIDKLRVITESMDIPSDVTTDVITSILKKDPASLIQQISSAIVERFNQ